MSTGKEEVERTNRHITRRPVKTATNECLEIKLKS